MDFYRLDDKTVAGYVVDVADLTQRFVVELVIDGYPLRLARADIFTNELAIEGLGDGCYGFVFAIPERATDRGTIIEARLANSDIAVGHPIAFIESDNAHPIVTASEISWLGGLRFEGWCIAEVDDIPTITALIEGEQVAQAAATRWINVGNRLQVRLARRFDLNLPVRFADGLVRRVKFVREDGQTCPGSPLTIVAFPDGLKEAIRQLNASKSELLRAEQFDRLLPMSMPFSEYSHWSETFPILGDDDGSNISVAVILVGPANPKRSLVSLRTGDHSEWVAAALPSASGQLDFNPDHLREFLLGDAALSEYVIFTHSGTRFASNALRRIIAAFKSFSETSAIYGDFDILAQDGKIWPIALSAFDYERLLEQGYCAHLFALRREVAEKALESGATSLYRLFNFVLDDNLDCKRAIVHLPGSLATLVPITPGLDSLLLTHATDSHLRARGIGARVTRTPGDLFPAVRVVRSTPQGATTIVIPVRNQLELLQSCLRSIRPAVERDDVDILIVDNGSSDPDMLQFLGDITGRRVSVLRVPGIFNFAHLNNIAAESTKSDFLCMLNNDVEAIDDQWLTEILSRINEEDVGAVGALLIWPSGVVQHGGTVLGPNFAATHAFCERLQTDPGYADLLCVAHECSAVTAACMITRRRDYLDVGGMDEVHFPVNFNDVDYCLKLRARGKRIIFTPHAKLFHAESASRGHDSAPDRAARFSRELQNLRARWGEYLLADPYYSPILSLDSLPFSALAWPPRPCSPRTTVTPIAIDIPAGF